MRHAMTLAQHFGLFYWAKWTSNWVNIGSYLPTCRTSRHILINFLFFGISYLKVSWSIILTFDEIATTIARCESINEKRIDDAFALWLLIAKTHNRFRRSSLIACCKTAVRFNKSLKKSPNKWPNGLWGSSAKEKVEFSFCVD